MAAPFTSGCVLRRVLTTEGILPILSHPDVRTGVILEACDDVVDFYSDWDSDQGFGTSDMTYVVKEAIDQILRTAGLSYKTEFKPHLMVV